MTLLPKDRAPYSAIVDRPRAEAAGQCPRGALDDRQSRIWDIGRPMARQVIPAPTGQVLLPDVPNWSWHEYGMRVGTWRFFKLYEKLGIRPTLSINARVCEDYTRVAEQARDAGWEFMGHAYDQMPMHKHDDPRGMIFKSMDILEKFTGKRPAAGSGRA